MGKPHSFLSLLHISNSPFLILPWTRYSSLDLSISKNHHLIYWVPTMCQAECTHAFFIYSSQLCKVILVLPIRTPRFSNWVSCPCHTASKQQILGVFACLFPEYWWHSISISSLQDFHNLGVPVVAQCVTSLTSIHENVSPMTWMSDFRIYLPVCGQDTKNRIPVFYSDSLWQKFH